MKIEVDKVVNGFMVSAYDDTRIKGGPTTPLATEFISIHSDNFEVVLRNTIELVKFRAKSAQYKFDIAEKIIKELDLE
jgi:hypothetical protein